MREATDDRERDDPPDRPQRGATRGTPAKSYSSGEAARILGISRRQLHLSVRRGELAALRTPGGHLRFRRVSLVRTFRRLERPIPKAVASAPGQVLVVADERRGTGVLGVRASTPGLVDAAMLLSYGDYELVVLALEPDLAPRLDLVRALRRFPPTLEIAILGVGEREPARREFVWAGGDIAVARWSDVQETARFLLGIERAADRPRAAACGAHRGEPSI